MALRAVLPATGMLLASSLPLPSQSIASSQFSQPLQLSHSATALQAICSCSLRHFLRSEGMRGTPANSPPFQAQCKPQNEKAQRVKVADEGKANPISNTFKNSGRHGGPKICDPGQDGSCPRCSPAQGQTPNCRLSPTPKPKKLNLIKFIIKPQLY